MIILGNQGVVFTDLEELKKGFAVLAEKAGRDYSSDKITEFYISLLKENKILIHRVKNLSEANQYEILKIISLKLEKGESIDFEELEE